MRLVNSWQKVISILIPLFCFKFALADTFMVNIQDIPPPPGLNPGSCWLYENGFTPLNVSMLGITFFGDVQNAGGFELNPDGTLTNIPCYNLDFSQFGSVLLDNLGAVGMSFNPNVLQDVTSVSVSGVTSFCQIFFRDPITGAFIKNPDGTLKVEAGHPDITVITSYGGSIEGVPPSSTLLLSGPSEASVNVSAPMGESISSIQFKVGPPTAECLAGLNGAAGPTSGLISGSIVIQTGSALDLAISSPLVISQNGNSISPGGAVSPGQPVQVTVPVSGSGFNASETRSTTVTLQAGSQSYSQTINLADIKSAGTLNVPFTVIFGAQDLGMQTITATVDPGNVLNESNFSNNMGNVGVDVVGYKLVAFFNGNTTPIPDSGGKMTLVPSRKACGALSETEDGDTDVEIRCVTPGDPSYTAVPGCKFLLDLSQGSDTGGHNHNLGDETRPFVLDPTFPSFPVGQFLSVDTYGNNLTYTPPEVSGDVFFEVTGTDPAGNSIQGPSFMFQIKDTTLDQMVSLNDAGASANNPGISVVTGSHPGAGVYGTTAIQAQVAAMVARYYQLGDDHGFMNLDPLESQAGTMMEGGLFDANWNGAINPSMPTPWSPPHCGHRNGLTIDLSINQLDSDERDWLAQAATRAGFVFTNPLESSKNANANHWHAVLGGFQ